MGRYYFFVHGRMFTHLYLINKTVKYHSSNLLVKPNTMIISAQKLQGKVTSISMDKTVTVTINRLVEHQIYGKRSKSSKKILAHAEGNNCKLGEEVELQPSRPLSKRKRFIVSRIIKSENKPLAETLDSIPST